jgi:hypothetical protein
MTGSLATAGLSVFREQVVHNDGKTHESHLWVTSTEHEFQLKREVPDLSILVSEA